MAQSIAMVANGSIAMLRKGQPFVHYTRLMWRPISVTA